MRVDSNHDPTFLVPHPPRDEFLCNDERLPGRFHGPNLNGCTTWRLPQLRNCGVLEACAFVSGSCLSAWSSRAQHDQPAELSQESFLPEALIPNASSHWGSGTDLPLNREVRQRKPSVKNRRTSKALTRSAHFGIRSRLQYTPSRLLWPCELHSCL